MQSVRASKHNNHATEHIVLNKQVVHCGTYETVQPCVCVCVFLDDPLLIEYIFNIHSIHTYASSLLPLCDLVQGLEWILSYSRPTSSNPLVRDPPRTTFTLRHRPYTCRYPLAIGSGTISYLLHRRHIISQCCARRPSAVWEPAADRTLAGIAAAYFSVTVPCSLVIKLIALSSHTHTHTHREEWSKGKKVHQYFKLIK